MIQLCVALVVAGGTSGDARPAIMDAALRARSFDKADIHVRVEDQYGWREFRTRAAGFEILNESPQCASLQYKGKVWCVFDQQHPAVIVHESVSPPLRGGDLRYLGLGAFWSMDAVPTFAPDAHSFRTETDGNRTTVFCVEHGARCVYVFDSTQGNSLVRIEKHKRRGVQVFEIVNAQYDGFWFPQTMTVTYGGQWRSTVTVLSAKFEQADMPDHLSPADLNVGLGTNVMQVSAGGVFGPIESYDGTKIVPMKTAWRMRQSGDYPPETWGKPYKLLPMQFSPPAEEQD